jgi:hypothetical protein
MSLPTYQSVSSLRPSGRGLSTYMTATWPERALISVQQRIFLMLLGLHDQGSSRKNPQFLNRSV